MAPDVPARLQGSLGVPGVVFMVVAAAAPLTAIGGAGPVALALGNGAGLPGAYLFAAAVRAWWACCWRCCWWWRTSPR